jgi:hypothetical protein
MADQKGVEDSEEDMKVEILLERDRGSNGWRKVFTNRFDVNKVVKKERTKWER